MESISVLWQYSFPLVALFVLQPVIEYGIHRFLHFNLDPSGYHKEHHAIFHSRPYSKYMGDKNMYLISAIGYYFIPQWYLLWLGIMKYEIFHMIIHRYPNLFPKLSDHHKFHHVDFRYNQSFSAIWPDKLFGTYKDPDFPRN